MSIVDTKPFMLPVALHRIFVHRPQVIGTQVLPDDFTGFGFRGMSGLRGMGRMRGFDGPYAPTE